MENIVELGKIAGIAGIALGVLMVVFRDVIRKNIFSKLPSEKSYRLLRLIILLTWTVAILGIIVWASPNIAIGSGVSISIQEGEKND